MPSEPFFYGEFIRMQREMESLLDFFFGTKRPPAVMGGVAWTPAADVYETKKTFVIRLEIAGLRTKDVEMTVIGDTLRIRGERVELGDPNKQTYHQMEINYGVFERVILLPCKINSQKIKTRYRNGFLEVVIAKGIEEEEVAFEVEKEE